MVKPNSKASASRAIKPRAGAAADDDTKITALTLPAAPLSPEMAAYFAKCEEKLGLIARLAEALLLGFTMV